MVREPPRKCSFCGQHGHNSRTCNNKASGSNGSGPKAHCVKLFGVNIRDEKAVDPMKKSRSMGNLENDAATSSDESGYLSDGLILNKRRKATHERKKGTPWSEEEHRTFLIGLNELGKGDWRGISMKYVQTRTPTQVASHAQKYFLRKNASNGRKKRRSSLFDMPFAPFFDMPFAPDDSAQVSSPWTEYGGENLAAASSSSSRPQLLPRNSSTEVINRFPHLCLDNYPVRIRPAHPAYHHPSPSYQSVPYPYTMGLGIPANVHPWAVNMMSYGTLSYMYNPNIPKNGNGFVPFMVPHPSGIPPPRSPLINPAATSVPSQAERGDGLELRIALPQSKPSSSPSSPASGAIRVT